MYQKVCFNQGTEAGGGKLMWATCSAPPSHFMLATGLVTTCKLEGNKDKFVRRTSYKETRTGGARIVLKDTCKDSLTLAKNCF